MTRNVHSDMTCSSPIFSQKRKLKSRESLSNALTSTALPRHFILTWHVHVKYQYMASLRTPFPFLIPPWPQEVKSLAEQPLNISVTGSLEGHDRQADDLGARYSLSIFDLDLGRKPKEHMSNPRRSLICTFSPSWNLPKKSTLFFHKTSSSWSHRRALLHTCGFSLRPPWFQVFVDGARLTKARGSTIQKTRIHIICAYFGEIFPNQL